MPREQVEHYSWMCLGRCFWKRLAFEWVNSGKQMALPRVGGGLNRTGRWRKFEFALLSVSLTELRYLSSDPVLLVLRPSSLYLDVNH